MSRIGRGSRGKVEGGGEKGAREVLCWRRGFWARAGGRGGVCW